MHCSWIQQHLLAYSEGELSGFARVVTRLHLQVCPSCLRDADLLEGARSPLKILSAPEPPSSLATQLRAAISVELARGNPWQWRINRWKASFREGMRPMAIRTLGGSLSALVLFSAIIPDLWSLPVKASDDVPLTYLTNGLVSKAQQLPSKTLNPFSEDTEILVFIDTRGKMYDFELVSEEQRENARLRAEIAQLLLLAEFQPATFFGQPVLGRVLISFKTVKG